VLLLLGGLATGVAVAQRPDPGALWKIVHDRCEPHARQGADPAPCALVSLTDGYAVLKDNSPAKPLHYLMIPTERLSGIEDPAVLAAGRPNRWAEAWDARRFVAARAGRDLARDEVALAINSPHARSQNQLHIHVACLKRELRAALAEQAAAIGATFAALPKPLLDQPYRAMRLLGEALTADPFQLAAASGAHLDRATMVVVGAAFAEGPGFIVLLDEADPARGDFAHGEDLLAPDC
jgi:CDP-diacylglycerol pyrophosphatase